MLDARCLNLPSATTIITVIAVAVPSPFAPNPDTISCVRCCCMQVDVLLYRNTARILWASTRTADGPGAVGTGNWTYPQITNITDDKANSNAGGWWSVSVDAAALTCVLPRI